MPARYMNVLERRAHVAQHGRVVWEVNGGEGHQ